MFKKLLAAGVVSGLGLTGLLVAFPGTALANTPSSSCSASQAFGPGTGGSYQVAVNGIPAGSSLAGAGIVGGDTVTVTYTIAPACVGTQVGLATYNNPAGSTFDASVTQTLLSSQERTAASGTLTVTVPVVSTNTACTPLQSPYPSGGNGANTGGAYDPTCSTPGQHGNEPATGSVGNADAKNPPGQYPNGSDPNAGYECDRNQGVGQGNPAHTACTAAPVLGWQIDLFVGPLLQTVGPPSNYYATTSRLVAAANG